jgi:hypothetical protein
MISNISFSNLLELVQILMNGSRGHRFFKDVKVKKIVQFAHLKKVYLSIPL